jgi:hypothetical protein
MKQKGRDIFMALAVLLWFAAAAGAADPLLLSRRGKPRNPTSW